VCVIVVGQILIVELLYNFFNVEPFFHTMEWQFNLNGFIDWLIIVGLTSLVFWIREAWNMVANR
jgi:Ca2+-transporting ATPase